MNNSMILTPGYYTTENIQARIIKKTSGYFDLNRVFKESEIIDYSSRVLPVELDIFSDLPKSVYENEDVHQFLLSLRKKIIQCDKSVFSGIALSKLNVAEHTDRTIILEWIFNYFRVYFGFDKHDGDFYGKVMNNPDRGEFYNDMKMMTKDEFDDVAEENLSYVVTMAQG